jgi:hypothetical protein
MLKISFKLLAVLITIPSGLITFGVASQVAIANEALSQSTIETKNSIILLLKPVTANLQSQVPVPEEKKPEEKKETNAFSLNTKLQGQVIFGLTSGLSGDISRNAALGQRTRLELLTNLGSGTLTTRLQIDGIGTPNSTVPAGIIDTPEGASSFGVTEPRSQVNLDLLKYELPIGQNTQLLPSQPKII